MSRTIFSVNSQFFPREYYPYIETQLYNLFINFPKKNNCKIGFLPLKNSVSTLCSLENIKWVL